MLNSLISRGIAICVYFFLYAATYSNEKSEARISESASEVDSNSSSGSLEE
ncbi:hypothetical protein Patl1_02201 [Pistacia atlantica]|uniref:Uncharacterized protein n=1 Tax=Pistacia atlantica TaxID=434234 RepID=A0ACC1C6U4_9ROSI|nr:hypothetical protein Patl1_02201 [Pistacia atlantica]